MSSTIKDIKEFSKLFRIRIPVESEFDYYVETLARSPEFHWLPEKVKQFAEFEAEIEGEEIGSHKMAALSHLKRILGNTRTYYDFSRYDAGVPGHRRDNLHRHRGQFLLTIDIKQSSYAVFRAFDRYREFPENWEEFCDEEKIPKLFSSSKPWCQLVFGNLNPKRSLRFQHIFMQCFTDLLRPLGFRDDVLLTMGPDEATLIIGETPEEAAQTMQAVQLMAQMVAGPDCSDLIPWPFRGTLQIQARPHRLETIGKGAYLREKYVLKDGNLELSHKSLFGVPGSQYFMHFKKDILGEEYDERDLLFFSDHKLAKWVVS